MTAIFSEFHEAQRFGSGHMLASCLAPVNTPEHPRRLESFASLSNYQTIAADIRYYLLQDKSISVKLPKSEGNAWVDIFVALWTTVKELLDVDDSKPQPIWSKTFNAYKELCNLLIRAYTSNGLQAWTVPCYW